MAVSSQSVPKAVIPALRNIPRDIFDTREALAPAVAPAFVYINMLTFKGIGLDCQITNANAVAGNAIVTFDQTKIVTLAPGQTFTLDNVLFMNIRIARAAAAAILVDCYFAGISNDVLNLLMK